MGWISSLSVEFVHRVLSLETLVKTKEETGQEKDKAVLPVLRRVLEERAKSSEPRPKIDWM